MALGTLVKFFFHNIVHQVYSCYNPCPLTVYCVRVVLISDEPALPGHIYNRAVSALVCLEIALLQELLEHVW